MLAIDCAQYSGIGDRAVNEDYACSAAKDGSYIFVLADGLGGHGMGDIASRLVCEAALQHFKEAGKVDDTWILSCLEVCQEQLLQRQQVFRTAHGMRTTINLLCLSDGFAHWGHIGDSRTYFFQGGDLIRRTRDHSVPQALADAGRIQEQEIRFHEDRNRLLKALGMKGVTFSRECEPPVRLRNGQRFLLCTDGFWEPIAEDRMLRCLRRSDGPKTWLELMAASLRGKSSRDNATAVAVWVTEIP